MTISDPLLPFFSIYFFLNMERGAPGFNHIHKPRHRQDLSTLPVLCHVLHLAGPPDVGEPLISEVLRSMLSVAPLPATSSAAQLTCVPPMTRAETTTPVVFK